MTTLAAIGAHWQPIATRMGDEPWIWRLSSADILKFAVARAAGQFTTAQRRDGNLWILLARNSGAVTMNETEDNEQNQKRQCKPESLPELNKWITESRNTVRVMSQLLEHVRHHQGRPIQLRQRLESVKRRHEKLLWLADSRKASA